jgi:hypothetical protein
MSGAWVILEPILFYLLLRGVRLKDGEMWVVLDAFVLSGRGAGAHRPVAVRLHAGQS